MRRIFVLFLSVALLFSLCPSVIAADVQRSSQALRVNGELVTCDVYNIDGSNYFKLRDMAQMLNGTGSQFSVGCDSAAKAITVTKGAVYISAGGELSIGDDLSATAAPSTQAIYINGELNSKLTAYNIGGNNFFKLRDLGEALGFSVDYDGAAKTMLVQSTEPPASDPTVWGLPADTIVYVSSRSHTIHSVHDCSGMKNYREMTLGEANERGYAYCPNCWPEGFGK